MRMWRWSLLERCGASRQWPLGRWRHALNRRSASTACSGRSETHRGLWAGLFLPCTGSLWSLAMGQHLRHSLPNLADVESICIPDLGGFAPPSPSRRPSQRRRWTGLRCRPSPATTQPHQQQRGRLLPLYLRLLPLPLLLLLLYDDHHQHREHHHDQTTTSASTSTSASRQQPCSSSPRCGLAGLGTKGAKEEALAQLRSSVESSRSIGSAGITRNSP